MKNFEDFLKERNCSNLLNDMKKEFNFTNQLSHKQKEEGAYQAPFCEITINEEKIEFDRWKSKVLRYVLYKKRTEQEVRQKFSSTIEENLLEDIIENLKESHYINDENYMKRAMDEFLAIHTLSIKEMRCKLYAKGLKSDIIDTYFSNHQEELKKYEINCAKKIILKKQSQMEEEKIEMFLYKKGYQSESIKTALEEIEES